jgi:5-methylcytosine-specific restriction endonuclease McrA
MPRTVKTRNGGKWTEATFWSAVRSALRQKFRYWGPAAQAKQVARRPNQSDNPRMKWEFQCRKCTNWFPDKEVQVDHIFPCGSLKNCNDIAGFLARLTPESPEAFQVLCRDCHQQKTNQENKK